MTEDEYIDNRVMRDHPTMRVLNEIEYMRGEALETQKIIKRGLILINILLIVALLLLLLNLL